MPTSRSTLLRLVRAPPDPLQRGPATPVPATPAPLDDVWFDQMSVAVLSVDGQDSTVFAVENNGFTGSHGEVLAAASRHGRAASMYRNVNAVTQPVIRRAGELVDAWETDVRAPTGRRRGPRSR